MFTKTMARRISATLALMLPSLAAVASADGATLTIVEGGSAIVTAAAVSWRPRACG